MSILAMKWNETCVLCFVRIWWIARNLDKIFAMTRNQLRVLWFLQMPCSIPNCVVTIATHYFCWEAAISILISVSFLWVMHHQTECLRIWNRIGQPRMGGKWSGSRHHILPDAYHPPSSTEYGLTSPIGVGPCRCALEVSTDHAMTRVHFRCPRLAPFSFRYTTTASNEKICNRCILMCATIYLLTS